MGADLNNRKEELIMKKFLAMLMAMAMVLSLAACSSGNNDSSDTSDAPAETATVDTDTDADADADEAEDPEEATGEATGDADRNGDGKVLIAYSCVAGTDLAPWSGVMQTTVEQMCADRGWECSVLSAAGDPSLQGSQIETLLTEDPDYLLCFVGDADMMVDSAELCADQDVPFITLSLDCSDPEFVTAYCGADQQTMSAGLAEAALEDVGEGFNYVMISGVPVQMDYILREAGIKDTLGDKATQLGDTQYAYSSRDDAKTYMENLIATYGEQIDVLFGLDDDLTLGAVEALQSAGLTDVKVYSITGQNDAFDAIADGKVTMTVVNSAADCVKTAFDVIDQLANGEEVEHDNIVPVTYVDASNVADWQGKGEF
jgi:ABC-type sugar transport system substrate-binding protein